MARIQLQEINLLSEGLRVIHTEYNINGNQTSKGFIISEKRRNQIKEFLNEKYWQCGLLAEELFNAMIQDADDLESIEQEMEPYYNYEC